MMTTTTEGALMLTAETTPNGVAPPNDVPGEVWLRATINGVPHSKPYYVSDAGRVCNPSGHILKPSYPSPSGSGWVSLPIDGVTPARMRAYRIDRLVLWTFVGKPPHPRTKPVHANNNRQDCRLANLGWGSAPRTAKKKTTPKKKKTTSTPTTPQPVNKPGDVDVVTTYSINGVSATVTLGSATTPPEVLWPERTAVKDLPAMQAVLTRILHIHRTVGNC